MAETRERSDGKMVRRPRASVTEVYYLKYHGRRKPLLYHLLYLKLVCVQAF